MKPDATKHNPDPEYLRELIEITRLSPDDVAARTGIPPTDLENYLMPGSIVPYPVQFAVEQLTGRFDDKQVKANLKKDINIAGKDYLTVPEAAHYACVSVSQWKARARDVGIMPFSFLGKTVYRKMDIMKAMEKAREWRLSPERLGTKYPRPKRTLKK